MKKLRKQNILSPIIVLLLMNFLFTLPSQAEFSLFDANKEVLEEMKGGLDNHSDYLDEKIEKLENKLDNSKSEINSLQTQLKVFDFNIKEQRNKIKAKKNIILMEQKKINKLKSEIDYKREFIEAYKSQASDYIVNLYLRKNTFQKNLFWKFLFSSNSFAEIINKQMQGNLIMVGGANIIEELAIELDSIDDLEKKERDKLLALRDLRESLEKTEQSLINSMNAKENLLKQTYGKQEIYAKLLEISFNQKMQVLKDIKNLDDSIFKLENLISDFDKFNWPVALKYGISAGFKDESYKKVFGREHFAIDIPIEQGSAIYAPATAVVYKVRDNGMGYSYIILAHKSTLLTVYGHISQPLVLEGDMVSRGEKIALSGGMPGTPGAGLMTTGPHLHFEVIENGKHVDPMKYMKSMD